MMIRFKIKRPLLFLFPILLVSLTTSQNGVAQGPVIFVEDPKTVGTAQATQIDPKDSYRYNEIANTLNAQPNTFVMPADPYASGLAELAAQQAASAKSDQSQALIGALLPACAQAAGGLFGGGAQGKKNEAFAEEMREVYDSAGSHSAASAGPIFNPKPFTMTDDASLASTRFGSGCKNFIDDKGNLGPWGKILKNEIRGNPAFNSTPKDMSSLCPGYSNFSQDQRENFWVHTFMAMSSNESSCKTSTRTAENVGLLQLDSNACGAKSAALYDARVNLTCGVRVLGRELGKRNTLTKDCSDCKGGTYWAVLRSDGTALSNKTELHALRAREVNGSKKTQILIGQFQGCRQ